MSSIYRADRGRIRVAGRLAPFIELGVGFNPELTSRENVVLNGVMMGLGRREAQRRLDAVLDFAELREFADLKLKNYSSGMMVRLAFAVMVEADADIMLVDEVLAVGDAAFAQKCMDVFHARRAARAARSCSSRTTWRRSRACATGRCCSTTATLRLRRRPAGGGAALLPGQLRARSTRAPTRTRPAASGTSTCAPSTPGSRTPPATGWRTSSRVSRSACGSCSRRAASSRRRSSASTSSTRRATRSSASTGRRRSTGEPDRWCPTGGRVRIGGTIENRAAARALLRPVLRGAQPRAGRLRAAPPAAARLRRLRHARRAREPCGFEADVEAEVLEP